MEKIYTIPVNEAFDDCREHPERGCPLCSLEAKLEASELDTILGASMMEPAIRMKTNEQGFCRAHLEKMFGMKNRLGLALMLESYFDEKRKAFSGASDKRAERIIAHENDCYICSKVDFHFSKMIDTVVYLYDTEQPFREKFAAAPRLCLSHYARLVSYAKKKLSRKVYPDFAADCDRLAFGYYDALSDDIKWFIKKFDYRYENEPWGNSKDAVERAIGFLRKK